MKSLTFMTILIFSFILMAEEITVSTPGITKQYEGLVLPFFNIEEQEQEPMIVNGTETGYTDWQGVVGLIMNVTGGQALCTATLIDPEILLTAGHCVYLKENGVLSLDAVTTPSKITAYYGASIAGWNSKKLAGVKKIKKHDTWSGDINNTGQNIDMAVIQLDKKIMDKPIYAVRVLPKETVGEVGVIVGYGITSTNAQDSGVHRKGDAKLIQFQNMNGKTIIEIGGPSGTCQGDSGGPFFTKQNNQWVVSGITSFGGQVCYADKGGYDTHVLTSKAWLDAAVKELTGHELVGPFKCGDADDICTTGATKDCAAVDTAYQAGKMATCNVTCSGYDMSGCTPVCGDGKIVDPEVCDGDTRDCFDMGNYLSGTKAPCNKECTGFDTSVCKATVCGDGKKEGKEFCDGGKAQCSTLGNYQKNKWVSCKPDCSYYDVSQCVPVTGPYCGDGNVDSGEECDDGNLATGDGCDDLCKKEGTSTPDNSAKPDNNVAVTDSTQTNDNAQQSDNTETADNATVNDTDTAKKNTSNSGCSMIILP